MSLTRLLTAAAASALLAGPALAGPEPAYTPDPADQPMSEPMTAPAATQSGAPASTTVIDPAAPAVILLDSPTPPETAWTLKAGDPNVVTNGPVPDTAENRALYGQPMSRAGKRTAPRGN